MTNLLRKVAYDSMYMLDYRTGQYVPIWYTRPPQLVDEEPEEERSSSGAWILPVLLGTGALAGGAYLYNKLGPALRTGVKARGTAGEIRSNIDKLNKNWDFRLFGIDPRQKSDIDTTERWISMTPAERMEAQRALDNVNQWTKNTANKGFFGRVGSYISNWWNDDLKNSTDTLKRLGLYN